MTNEQRIAIERHLAQLAAETLINAGYQVTVNDGEEDVLEYSTNVQAILDAMFSTDEDYLFATQAGPAGQKGWVRFIYGNSGFDVINDLTVNLESVMAPVFAEADRLEADI
jgi:hypothetical protein